MFTDQYATVVMQGLADGATKGQRETAARHLRLIVEEYLRAGKALALINNVRNSIIGLQTINWSEHIYPLVAALEEGGIKGMEYPDAKSRFGTMLERTKKAEADLEALKAAALRAAEHLRCKTFNLDDVIADNGGLAREMMAYELEGAANLRLPLEPHVYAPCKAEARVDGLLTALKAIRDWDGPESVSPSGSMRVIATKAIEAECA